MKDETKKALTTSAAGAMTAGTGSIGEWWPVEKLQRWKRNPKNAKGFAKKVEAVAASIDALGFGPPIVARRSDTRIAIGHTRLEAAKRLGWVTVPVRWIECDDAQLARLALADNKLGESQPWDADALDELLHELGDVPGFERPDEDATAELEDLNGGPKEPTTPEFWISVRGPLMSQPDVLDRLRAELELAGCMVTAGVLE